MWDGDVIALEIVRNPDDEEIRRSEWVYEPETFIPLAKRETGSARSGTAAEGEEPAAPETRLFYTVTDHLGTPREMLSEDGKLVWAAEYTTWGQIRRLWQADNDDAPADPSGHGSPGGEGRLTIEEWLGPREGIQGNLALAPIDGPEAHTCPIRFQGQWADEETDQADFDERADVSDFRCKFSRS